MQSQRYLLAGLSALGLVVAPGCESMESPGRPFAPAAADQGAPATSQAATPAGDATESPWQGDPSWAEPEAFQISSEEMLGTATPEVEPGATTAPTEDATEEAASTPAPVEVAPSAPTVASPTSSQVAVATVSTLSGWPLRLVKTVPEAMPPRAILGLPDGRELVVSPGTLVADQGIVVVSISRDHVELARVEARGDHASITPVTLLAQY